MHIHNDLCLNKLVRLGLKITFMKRFQKISAFFMKQETVKWKFEDPPILEDDAFRDYGRDAESLSWGVTRHTLAR